VRAVAAKTEGCACSRSRRRHVHRYTCMWVGRLSLRDARRRAVYL
jgi:hypothetical protein